MEIVYADPRIVVAVKPAGVLSTDEPGGMPQLLRQELGTPCIRTVHRLDAAVSGLMVYARSAKAASLLSEQIRSRTFGKEYLAVVHGVPEGGVMTDLLGRDPVRRRTYVAAEPGKDVRPAELSYEVLGSREGLSLVRIRLHTGRTHQIRVQFASRGFPLVGDRKYGGGGRGKHRPVVVAAGVRPSTDRGGHAVFQTAAQGGPMAGLPHALDGEIDRKRDCRRGSAVSFHAENYGSSRCFLRLRRKAMPPMESVAISGHRGGA